MSLIAETAVVFVFADGRSGPGRIGVGAPYRAEGGEFRCDVVLEGLEPNPFPVAGASSLQALTLGLRFAAKFLTTFVSRGGRILLAEEGGEDFPLAAYFGALAPEASAPAVSKSAEEVAVALSEGINLVAALAEGLGGSDERPHREAIAAADAGLVRLLDAHVAVESVRAARAALATLVGALGTDEEAAAASTALDAIMALFDALGRDPVYLG